MKYASLISSALLASALFLSPLASFAYILPTRTILQKTAENAGSGIYAVEQDVQFANGEEILHLKESWLIENDRSMRLTVTGTKELQNTFKLQFIYQNGQRLSLVGGSKKSDKISDDFLEKYLNFRNPELMANSFAHEKILPNGAYSRKIGGAKSTDFKYDPEPWVRYSRTGGVPNYALGMPTPVDQEAGNAGAWIEQDSFLLRKIRLPSQSEMTADNYNQFAKGLHYPRSRTVRWGNNTVNIRLISVAARPSTTQNLLTPSSIDSNLKLEGLEKQPAKEAVIEFYSRFR